MTKEGDSRVEEKVYFNAAILYSQVCIDPQLNCTGEMYSLWRLSNKAACTAIWVPVMVQKHTKTTRSARSRAYGVTTSVSMLSRSRGLALATLRGRSRIRPARGHSADKEKVSFRTGRGHTAVRAFGARSIAVRTRSPCFLTFRLGMWTYGKRKKHPHMCEGKDFIGI